MASPLAASTNTYHTYSFEQALDGIARAGFKGVELCAVPGWTAHVSLDASPADVKSQVEGFGLTATSLSAHSDLTTAEGLDHGVKAVGWAARYGLPVVNTAIGGHQSAQEDGAAFLANIGALAEAAKSAGVVVALEIHGDIMSCSELAVPVIEKIGSDWVRVNYDTANVEFYSGKKAADDISEIVPYIAHVHLKDTAGGKGNWSFPACGQGTVDFPRILRILQQAGYKGAFSVETEFSGEPWPPLEEVDKSMRTSYEYLSGLGLR